jgi:hypothetical protein
LATAALQWLAGVGANCVVSLRSGASRTYPDDDSPISAKLSSDGRSRVYGFGTITPDAALQTITGTDFDLAAILVRDGIRNLAIYFGSRGYVQLWVASRQGMAYPALDFIDRRPEPGVLFLMGAGLLGLGIARRRKSA